MNRDEWDRLALGDIIRGKLSSDGYIVADKVMADGKWEILLVRHQLAINPDEWDLVAKAKFEMS